MIGDEAGADAQLYYVDILTDPKIMAAVGGTFTALWTPCTSNATFNVLLTAATLGGSSRAPVTEDAFELWIKRVEALDVSTAENGAAFYSGPGNRALAEEFAVENGRMTLEMTPGGF